MKHKAGLRTGRRQFLKSMAGMAVAAPLVIPGSALGADGRVSANERIVLGHIGMGCRAPRPQSGNAPGLRLAGRQKSRRLARRIVRFLATATARTGTGIARGFGTGHASSQTAEYFNDSFASPWVFPSPFSSFAGFLRRVDLLQKPRKLQTVSFLVSFRLA